MAHIFKHPKGDTKGIIILTHKEMRFIYPDHPYFEQRSSRIDRLKNIVVKRKEGVNPVLVEKINRISEKYFIGVHFGWIHHNFPSFDIVDFHMGSPTTVSFEDQDSANFIPLDGSSFIPSFFHIEQPKDHLKLWDIIMVARDVRWKNLDIFLKTIRKIYDNGHKTTVLLVVPSGSAVDNNTHVTYTELLDDYADMFSYEERERFTVLKTHPNMPFLGLAQKQIAHFYHLSKTFALFSEEEGGSRVVSEALLAGLPVVVKSNLTGGGKDFLNASNSVFFDDFDQADEALLKAVDNWKTLNTDNEEVRKLTHERNSIESLKQYFVNLYESNGQNFDGALLNTDRLSFRLNAHWHEGLPWADKSFASPDIRTAEQFDLFTSKLEL
ncbi:MAG: hypothetical protein Salg2KO_14690 [Salibacteraceae bacterium]